MGMVYNKPSLCKFLRLSYMYFESVDQKEHQNMIPRVQVTEAVNPAQQRRGLLWTALLSHHLRESKASSPTYLEKSSCKVSGISSLGFPKVELNFSFSLSTNSLNSFAQTLEEKR